MITKQQLTAIAGAAADGSNMQSIIVALERYGDKIGLTMPHRLAHYIAQIAHESARFKYDQEIWGPTPAQRRYEDRADLGHSPAVPGEAFRFRGRTAMMLTGRYNYGEFSEWAKTIDPNAPDFEKNPDLVNTDPWEGLVPLWYWEVGNPERKSLNRYADENNIEMITRRINGGLNGFDDRKELYTRTALVMLGYEMRPRVIAKFQEHAGLVADDIAGPKTRDALHVRLLSLNPIEIPSHVSPPTIPPVVPSPSPAPEMPVEEEGGPTGLIAFAAIVISAIAAFFGWG